jgi:hypothetical protein
VVAVVVHDGDALVLAHDGEAPLHAAEAAQGLAQLVVRHAELVGHGDGGEAVEHVVRTGHAHLEAPERLAAAEDREARGQAGEVGVARAVVGLRASRR